MVYADFMNGDDSKTGVIFIFLVSIRKKKYPLIVIPDWKICSALSFCVYLA